MTRTLIALAAIASCAAPARAHAFLQHADPGAGASLSAAPKRVLLTLSEKLQPGSSGVSVTDAAGRSVVVAPVVVSGNSMMAPLRPLRPGSYRVAWHAVSVDDHRTQGAYRFVIKP